jgi:hypothetical protein
MKPDYSRILTELLITLKNLNDKAKKCEYELFEISAKLSKMEEQKPTATKHIVSLRIEDKLAKGDKPNGKD